MSDSAVNANTDEITISALFYLTVTVGASFCLIGGAFGKATGLLSATFQASGFSFSFNANFSFTGGLHAYKRTVSNCEVTSVRVSTVGKATKAYSAVLDNTANFNLVSLDTAETFVTNQSLSQYNTRIITAKNTLQNTVNETAANITATSQAITSTVSDFKRVSNSAKDILGKVQQTIADYNEVVANLSLQDKYTTQMYAQDNETYAAYLIN
jgi:methyl-accepting chemotaxis protein